MCIRDSAYPGTEMHRTMAIIKEESFEKPFMVDILKVISDSPNQYDLPFYFMGQVIQTSFEYETPKALETLGKKNGYQHLWTEGHGKAKDENMKLSWMQNRKFYTLTSTTSKDDELLFVRIGANDPEFNLRRDAALVLRRKEAQNTTFVSLVESHGNYSPVTESAMNSKSNIASIKIVHDDNKYTALTIEAINGSMHMLILSNLDAVIDSKHILKINNTEYQWVGPYQYGAIK